MSRGGGGSRGGDRGDHSGNRPGGLDRRALGSWLSGPGAVTGGSAGRGYPGQRLGLPAEGTGSVAGFGLRLLAFAIDAVLCNLIAVGLLRDQLWVTPIFVLEVLVLTAFVGGSFGQRVLRVRVARLDGTAVGLPRSAVRTALLCLLVPALIWDRDNRGLHDRAAGTVVVRG